MTIKEKISALAEAHPDLLGMRGELTYMLCSVIPENYDLSDMTLLDVMDILPVEHLEYIYDTITRKESRPHEEVQHRLSRYGSVPA